MDGISCNVSDPRTTIRIMGNTIRHASRTKVCYGSGGNTSNRHSRINVVRGGSGDLCTDGARDTITPETSVVANCGNVKMPMGRRRASITVMCGRRGRI